MSTIRVSALPDDVSQLAAVDHSEGHTHLDRLISEFHSGANRFSKMGEALFIAHSEMKTLVAIGGLNVDPYYQITTVGRVRRLYVHPDYRRTGIGAAIMHAIEAHASHHFSTIQLYTSSPTASAFYISLGYDPVSNQIKISHAKQLQRQT